MAAIEITTFRLVDGLDVQDFIKANRDIDPWLRKQPGFVSRHICARDDGSIIDIVFWETVGDGHRAASGIVSEMAGSPVHATIDQSTVDWSVVEVAHAVTGQPVQHR
jgi:hypothetical protein